MAEQRVALRLAAPECLEAFHRRAADADFDDRARTARAGLCVEQGWFFDCASGVCAQHLDPLLAAVAGAAAAREDERKAVRRAWRKGNSKAAFLTLRLRCIGRLGIVGRRWESASGAVLWRSSRCKDPSAGPFYG